MKEPLVSIITIVLNGELNIEDAILSVLNQTYCNIEYIVIDGGSTDRTLNIVSKYRSFIKRIVSEPDKGIYDAMNKGLSLASGEWIYFLNSDDYIFNNNTIQNIITHTGSNDFIYGNINLIFADTYNVVKGEVASIDSLPFKGIHHQSVFVKKDVIVKLGSFDERFKIGADYNFFVKVFVSGFRCKYVDLIVANMRDGGVSSKLILKLLDEKLVVINENYSRKVYWKSFVYQYLFERPRILIKLFLVKMELIGIWRFAKLKFENLIHEDK